MDGRQRDKGGIDYSRIKYILAPLDILLALCFSSSLFLLKLFQNFEHKECVIDSALSERACALGLLLAEGVPAVSGVG